MKYTLMDCAEQNKKHPDTFQIDDASDVQVGDFVKLVFEHPAHGGERMWVKIVAATEYEGEFIGVLDNEPIMFKPDDLKYADIIVFERRNIANVLTPEEMQCRTK